MLQLVSFSDTMKARYGIKPAKHFSVSNSITTPKRVLFISHRARTLIQLFNDVVQQIVYLSVNFVASSDQRERARAKQGPSRYSTVVYGVKIMDEVIKWQMTSVG